MSASKKSSRRPRKPPRVLPRKPLASVQQHDAVLRAYTAIEELAEAARPADAFLADAAKRVAETALTVLQGLRVGPAVMSALESEIEIIRGTYSELAGKMAGVMRREIEAWGGKIPRGSDPMARAHTAIVRIAGVAPPELRSKFMTLIDREHVNETVELLASYTRERSKRGKTARDPRALRQWQAIAVDLLVRAGIEPEPKSTKERRRLEENLARLAMTFVERQQWLDGKKQDTALSRMVWTSN